MFHAIDLGLHVSDSARTISPGHFQLDGINVDAQHMIACHSKLDDISTRTAEAIHSHFTLAFYSSAIG